MNVGEREIVSKKEGEEKGSARGSVHWGCHYATAHDIEVDEMMSLICSCRNKKEEPSSIYTFRKVRTLRGCLEGLALMI